MSFDGGMVDTRDLKSLDCNGHGSSSLPRSIFYILFAFCICKADIYPNLDAPRIRPFIGQCSYTITLVNQECELQFKKHYSHVNTTILPVVHYTKTPSTIGLPIELHEKLLNKLLTEQFTNDTRPCNNPSPKGKRYHLSDMSTTVIYADDTFLIINGHQDDIGGVHPIDGPRPISIYLPDLKIISLDENFTLSNKIALTELIIKKFAQYFNQSLQSYKKSYANDPINILDAHSPNEFIFHKNGMRLLYGSCSFSCAVGSLVLDVSFTELKPFVNEHSTLYQFMEVNHAL